MMSVENERLSPRISVSDDRHWVWSWCVADNTGSAHVLEKLGMRPEGRLWENEFYKDRWWDTLMYGILADEWERHPKAHPVLWKEIKDR